MIYFLLGATLLAGCAAWTDCRTGHIPNALTLGGLVISICGHLLRGASLDGLRGGAVEVGFALLGAALASLVPALMFVRGGMGGGDVKLFAALGAALHPMGGLEAETYAFVAALVLAPAKLAYEGTLIRTLLQTAKLALNPFRAPERRHRIPEAMTTWFRLGPAVFLGVAAMVIVHAWQWRYVP